MKYYIHMPVTRSAAVESNELTLRQKIIVFDGTSIGAETLERMADSDLTFRFMRSHGVRAVCLAAAGISPESLKARGAASCLDLKSVGFEAVDVVKDSSFCSSCIAAFGGEDVVETFLVTPADAIMFSGSPAMYQLGITPEQLLSACAGSATEAFWVLKQLPVGTSLQGVSVKVILDTGLRAQGMQALGYHPELLQKCTGCSRYELNLLYV